MSNNRTNISSNEQFFNSRPQLLYVTYSKFENDWQSLIHLHPCSEIFYVMGGKGQFFIENESFDIKKDDMIIVNPNVYHHENSDRESPLEYIVLGVDNLSFDLVMKYNDYLYQSFDKDNDDITFYITHLLMESEDKKLGFESVCQKLLELLLLKIIRKKNTNVFAGYAQKPMKREIKMICQYIDQNYSEDITLDSLADFMKMNKYYMAHEFKKNLDISPINYLNNRRIQECKSLLKMSSLSIAEISETVGFSSQSYFSQTFKKSTGMTPQKYRQQLIIETPEPITPEPHQIIYLNPENMLD